jgi:Ohr subfamily peroxiredoxin
MENYQQDSAISAPTIDAPQPQKKVLYTSHQHTTGGREGGASKSSDGNLDVQLKVPGTKGTGTNPEQLFAAGWSSCLFSAIKIAAGKKKIRLSNDAYIDAEVDLVMTGDEFSLQARLNINLPGIDHETALLLAEEGHKTCPYSKATRGNIDVVINVL